MFVGEICNRDVITIDRTATILEAARLMRDYHVGNVVVVETRNGNAHPVGILTDRDVVVEVIAEEVDINTVNVGDIMSYELLTAREEDEILDTLKRMKVKGVRRVPVTNNQGVLAGILTIDDMVELLAEQQSDIARLIHNEQEREKALRT